MEQKKVQIDGKDNLVRDMATGAVNNVDRTAYQAALVRKSQAEKITELEKTVEDLKQIVQALKPLKPKLLLEKSE